MRVSERLRHKQRAIVQWDYERMVLQKFPQVYKTKCIANTSLKGLKKTSEIHPGNIELVVIPGVNAEGSIADNNAPGPVFGSPVIEEIKEYLQQYASPHVQINVRNPLYEKLKVKCEVKFYESSPFFLQQLNDDIRKFLSPWILGNTDAYNIGEGIQKSTILGYIQQLEYVEFVTSFSIIKISEENGKFHFHDTASKNAENQDMLLAITPWSVFVSAMHHLITAVDTIQYNDPIPVGIGELSIEADFIIQKDPDKKGIVNTNTDLYFI